MYRKNCPVHTSITFFCGFIKTYRVFFSKNSKKVWIFGPFSVFRPQNQRIAGILERLFRLNAILSGQRHGRKKQFADLL